MPQVHPRPFLGVELGIEPLAGWRKQRGVEEETGRKGVVEKVVVVDRGGVTPGKAEEGCGEGVGEAVTDMSSSGGDRGAEVVANRPTWVGEAFGEVVL